MTSKQKRRADKRRRHRFGSISDPAVEQMEHSFEEIPRALLRRIIVTQPHPTKACDNCCRTDQPVSPVLVGPHETEFWCGSCRAYELGIDTGYLATNQGHNPWYKRLIGFARSHDRKAWS